MSLGATAGLAHFAARAGRETELPQAVKRAALRHVIDTLGVTIAGLGRGVAGAVAPLLPSGGYPLPGNRAGMTAGSGPAGLGLAGLGSSGLGPADHAYLCGTAAHGLELDDGYREGSVHPGVAVVPALMAEALAGYKPMTGRDFLIGLAVGYEAVCTLAGALHPALRDNGFHPTSAVGPLGAALAILAARGADPVVFERALGLAASEAGGLFAFLGGGGEVKRLHGGIAARGGYNAALLARAGISAPDSILERPSGYAQAFGGVAPGQFTLPPLGQDWRMTRCYIKPHACCRHLQPALEALIDLRRTHGFAPDAVQAIEVDTYSIAAAHADTGWGDMASAQLSFGYVLAQGLYKGRAALVDFEDAARSDGSTEALMPRLAIQGTAEMDALYPTQRPARVHVTFGDQRVSAFAPEASGSPDIPVTDAAISDKFLGLVSPKIGDQQAQDWLDTLWSMADAPDVSAVVSGV